LSHAPERKEKDCLNCGTLVHGRFCHVCGQENTIPKESFGQMIIHFFNDITHFDGKFFTSMKWLIRKPGFLSTEYMNGRRARYLHPVRMYIFTSAVFFIIFFSLFSAEQLGMSSLAENGQLAAAANDFSKEAYKNAKTKQDSLDIEKALSLLTPGVAVQGDSTHNKTNLNISIGKAAEKFKTVAAYDSSQALLPKSERDNWLERNLSRRGIVLQQKYRNNRQQFGRDIFDRFVHSLPYMLFVSLPLYALLLKLLYIRRKKFYFTDHTIFLVHLYIFTFLLLLLFFMFDRIDNIYPLALFDVLKFILGIGGVYYAFRAMKKFYAQGTAKTLFKFILFNILCFFSLIVLFTIFFIFSFYRL
jgi:hypothetical protein